MSDLNISKDQRKKHRPYYNDDNILRSVQSCLRLSIFELSHIKDAAGSKGFTGKFLSQTDQRLDEFTQ